MEKVFLFSEDVNEFNTQLHPFDVFLNTNISLVFLVIGNHFLDFCLFQFIQISRVPGSSFPTDFHQLKILLVEMILEPPQQGIPLVLPGTNVFYRFKKIWCCFYFHISIFKFLLHTLYIEFIFFVFIIDRFQVHIPV